MKTLVFGDIHANLPALHAILVEAVERGVDRAICTGDVVGSLGFNDSCVPLVRDVSDVCVYGNHDARVRNAYPFSPETPHQRQEMRVVSEQLSQGLQEWIESLPAETVWRPDENTYHVVHAHPFPEQNTHKCGYPANNYLGKRDFIEVTSQINADYLCIGHTHEQASLDCSKFGHDVTVVNPGSVGVPYDGEAEFAIIKDGDVSLHSAEYDTPRLQERFERLTITEDGDY